MAPAAASPATAAASAPGRITNSRISAVMSDDSTRHGNRSTRCARASIADVATASTTRGTSSSSGVGVTPRLNVDSSSANTARPASPYTTSRYIDMAPRTASTRWRTTANENVMRAP